jgi:acylphosphatase
VELEAVRRIVRVVVSGRVQGVGYRMWCVQKASLLGLEGWVRNLGDGAVEAVLAGEAAKVTQMIEACSGGPPMAKVSGVSVAEADAQMLDLRAGQGGFVVLANG